MGPECGVAKKLEVHKVDVSIRGSSPTDYTVIRSSSSARYTNIKVRLALQTTLDCTS